MRDIDKLFIFSRLSAFKIECSNLIITVGVSEQTTFFFDDITYGYKTKLCELRTLFSVT
jgi:hypothetical protein